MVMADKGARNHKRNDAFFGMGLPFSEAVAETSLDSLLGGTAFINRTLVDNMLIVLRSMFLSEGQIKE